MKVEQQTALKKLYGDEVMEQLISKGLRLHDNVTIEEVQYYLRMIKKVDEAMKLKEDLENFMKSKSRYMGAEVKIGISLFIPITVTLVVTPCIYMPKW